MGTNYYLRKIPTKKRRQELCGLIMNTNDWDKILDEITSTYGSFNFYGEPYGGQIHLGKSSGGWKFLWNPNIYIKRNGHSIIIEKGENYTKYGWEDDPDTLFQLYPLTKSGITDFVKNPEYEVYDEYGEMQNKDEFLDFAFNKKGFDGKSYQEKYPNHCSHYTNKSEYIQFLIDNGYDIDYPYFDFYSDDLRFATNTDFS